MPRTLVEGKAPGRRSQYGLPFQQLPAAGDITPESMINEQTRIGKQEIQQRFNLAWDEINRSARFIGRVKAGRMQRELHTKAKQEMLQFNQQAQAQTAQIQNTNRLAEQGFISPEDAARVNVGRVFGTDVANRMYPETKSVEQQFGALNISLNRIEGRLADFGREKKRIKKWYLGKEKEPIVPGKLEILDRSQLYTDDKGVVRQGIWRPATQQEVAEHRMLLQEQQRIKQLQADVLGRPDVRQRVVQPGTKGGTFGDKIAESVRPRQAPSRPAPKVIRQRNKRTGEERISYDGGRTWQATG